jgi:hypothetical protein
MNSNVITCLGYARAWLAVLSASLGASCIGGAGIDGNTAAQSRRGKRAPERVYVNAALGMGRHGLAHHRGTDPRLSHNSGDHARRTTMRGVAT